MWLVFWLCCSVTVVSDTNGRACDFIKDGCSNHFFFLTILTLGARKTGLRWVG